MPRVVQHPLVINSQTIDDDSDVATYEAQHSHHVSIRQAVPSVVVTHRRRGQRRLLLATVLLILGGWLPWLYTPAGPLSGIRGAGLWTFYAGMLALAGGLLPARFTTAALVQAGIVAVVAFALPIWQVARVLGLVGVQGWAPGPGLVMTLGGGALCALAVRDLMKAREASALDRGMAP